MEMKQVNFNGVEAKGVTKFTGHEGEPLLQGNIYLNGKKVAWASMGDWGGEMRIDVTKEDKEKLISALRTEIDKAKKESTFSVEFSDETHLEFLIEEILWFKQVQTELKRKKYNGEVTLTKQPNYVPKGFLVNRGNTCDLTNVEVTKTFGDVFEKGDLVKVEWIDISNPKNPKKYKDIVKF